MDILTFPRRLLQNFNKFRRNFSDTSRKLRIAIGSCKEGIPQNYPKSPHSRSRTHDLGLPRASYAPPRLPSALGRRLSARYVDPSPNEPAEGRRAIPKIARKSRRSASATAVAAATAAAAPTTRDLLRPSRLSGAIPHVVCVTLTPCTRPAAAKHPRASVYDRPHRLLPRGSNSLLEKKYCSYLATKACCTRGPDRIVHFW